LIAGLGIYPTKTPVASQVIHAEAAAVPHNMLIQQVVRRIMSVRNGMSLIVDKSQDSDRKDDSDRNFDGGEYGDDNIGYAAISLLKIIA
jgi:hypothetical protein